MKKPLLLVALLIPFTTGCQSMLPMLYRAAYNSSGPDPLAKNAEFDDHMDAHKSYEEFGAWPGRDY